MLLIFKNDCRNMLFYNNYYIQVVTFMLSLPLQVLRNIGHCVYSVCARARVCKYNNIRGRFTLHNTAYSAAET